jgi:hypothetical protein
VQMVETHPGIYGTEILTVLIHRAGKVSYMPVGGMQYFHLSHPPLTFHTKRTAVFIDGVVIYLS